MDPRPASSLASPAVYIVRSPRHGKMKRGRLRQEEVDPLCFFIFHSTPCIGGSRPTLQVKRPKREEPAKLPHIPLIWWLVSPCPLPLLPFAALPSSHRCHKYDRCAPCGRATTCTRFTFPFTTAHHAFTFKCPPNTWKTFMIQTAFGRGA